MRIEMTLAGLFLGCLLFAGPALAADCGDTTGPAATNVDCSCGDTVTTDTTLNAADPVTTVGCSGFAGLLVGTGVKLNLGGRTITGAPGNNTFGMALFSSCSVLGPGKVTRFARDGIVTFAGTSGQTIQGVQSRSNGLSGIAINTACTVRTNVVSDNNIGIFIFGGGAGSTLYSNTASNNRNGGIIAQGCPNTFTKNIASGNGREGIFLGCGGNAINNNEVYGSALAAISVAGDGSTLGSNKVESNQSDGIHVQGNNNALTLNSAKISGGDGIEVIGSGNRLQDNHGDQNTGAGVIAIVQGGPNVDNGKNTGGQNGGVQCQIDGAACLP